MITINKYCSQNYNIIAFISNTVQLFLNNYEILLLDLTEQPIPKIITTISPQSS